MKAGPQALQAVLGNVCHDVLELICHGGDLAKPKVFSRAWNESLTELAGGDAGQVLLSWPELDLLVGEGGLNPHVQKDTWTSTVRPHT